MSVVERPRYAGRRARAQLTFYWTNQQSGRLMFYHDHAYGITRLNVYAGEAAGYLLDGPGRAGPDQRRNPSGANHRARGSALLATWYPAGHPGQDVRSRHAHTRIPWRPAGWHRSHLGHRSWGGGAISGSPMSTCRTRIRPTQEGANPLRPLGLRSVVLAADGFRRLLERVQPVACPTAALPAPMCPGTPNPSLTPESFMDTIVVNGTAYPYMQVQPKTYRFRILNAANDRTINLQLVLRGREWRVGRNGDCHVRRRRHHGCDARERRERIPVCSHGLLPGRWRQGCHGNHHDGGWSGHRDYAYRRRNRLHLDADVRSATPRKRWRAMPHDARFISTL